MRKIMLLLSLFASFLFLISCSSLYVPATARLLPENIKKIYVKPFLNGIKLIAGSTNLASIGIEVIFTKIVEREIIRDGRLSLVNTEEEADIVLVAVIEGYILQPITYCKINAAIDKLSADQFKMLIKANVSLIDKSKGVILWNEPNMRDMHIYRDINKDSKFLKFNDGITESKARKTIFAKLSRRIIRQALK
ncbi:MAG: LPS assembly lipoprotein LptE [Endomicrobium sp.]|nr:LPS assembly lipoprotein LptE [Endomicrobium sp.]